MPHAAIIVTGAFIVGVAAWAVYKEVVEPNLERRRQDQEEEWSAHETERAIQLSLLEQQREEQRRADEERWQTSHASSSSARYGNPPAGFDGGIRRRRHAELFSDQDEMQQVTPNRANTSWLFDGGPSSRLDRLSEYATRQTADNEDAELLETAKSLSLVQQADSDGDILDSQSPQQAGGNLDGYSIIEPTSAPGSSLTSRSHSPVVVSHTNDPSLGMHFSNSRHDLTAASLEQMEAEQARVPNRAKSPVPTIHSGTGKLDNGTLSRPGSGITTSYVTDSKTPSEAAASGSTSPFSEIERLSANSSDNSIEYIHAGDASVNAIARSACESQWSDLGEDSSDEDEASELGVEEATTKH